MQYQSPQNTSTYPSEDEPRTVKPLSRSTLQGGVRIPAAILAILCFLLLGGGFVAGMQYQKGKTSSSTSSNTGQMGSGGTMGNQAGGYGTVTAVSSDSITLSQQTMGGPSSTSTATTKTYSISSSTTVTDSGSSVSVSSIAVGDTVLVQTSSTTSTAATSIQVNPTMGGGPGTTTGTPGN